MEGGDDRLEFVHRLEADGGRQKHGIDPMDNAVVGFDVCCNDRGLVDFDTPIGRDLQGGAFNAGGAGLAG